MKQDEQLIEAFCRGEGGVDEVLRRARLDPEFLNQLASHVALERLLRASSEGYEPSLFSEEVMARLRQQDGKEFADNVVAVIEGDKVTSKTPIWVSLSAVAAVVAVVLIWWAPSGEETVAGGGADSEFIQVVNTRGANWGGRGEVELIGQGAVRLESGVASLRMDNGVELLLEGPAQLEVVNPLKIRLEKGKLVAKVPEVISDFVVLTPCVAVSQGGNEYGVAVGENGNSEVHVMQGSLKATAKIDGKAFSLFGDDARRFTVSQQTKVIESHPEMFLRALPGKSELDPDYLYWSCDDEGAVLTCRGKGIEGHWFDGTLKSWKGDGLPQFVSGRRGKAIRFDGKGSYVTTDFQGIGGNAPRTVTFWAKVPRQFQLENGYGMLSWGQFKPGEAWQVSANPTASEGPVGRIRVGTVSAPVVGSTDLRDGQWHHIAVVMYGGEDADVSTHILLYVDGQLEQTTRKAIRRVDTDTQAQNSQSLILGKNMGFDGSKKQRAKFFKGELDDIYIFDAALSGEKIRELMAR